ncbi:MAG: DNA polymerase III subunit alpha, partial [Burkholderiales bacterium]
RVYKLFSEGRTESVFQFESPGMIRMLRDAKPSKLEDLIALNALYRPGPMDSIPSFCARKHGKEPITYPHPLLEDLLKETYGVIVYQEHVMQGAQILAGFSLGGADLLRRAMGKKKPEEMAKQRTLFRSGAAANGVTQAQADEVFDLMEKFAGYGFNKSHAAAYVLLAYHTAWIKVHCTAEFFAANMTVEADDTDKLRVLLIDAKTFGIEVQAPDVNKGVHRFEPVSDKVVQYGLGAIKGTGQGAIEAIVKARTEGGAFTSLFDFCARVDRQRINKRVVEALVKSGAFDALHPDRACMLASVGLALDWADSQAAHANQGGLFDFGGDDDHGASTQEPPLIAAETWSIKERLTLEKGALGFYLSGHLFDQSATEVRRFAKRQIADLLDSREPQLLAGIVTDLRVINGQRGRVAIFKLDDKSEAIEAVANEDLLNANKDLLKDDELIIVQGKVQPDRFSGGLRLTVASVWDLAGARCRFGKYVHFLQRESVPPFSEVQRDFPSRKVWTEQGELPTGLRVRMLAWREPAEGAVDLGDESRFYPTEAAIERLRAAAYQGDAEVIYE